MLNTKFLRIAKIILSFGFLAVAYAFLTENVFFGISAEVMLLVISVLALVILFFDTKNRTKP